MAYSLDFRKRVFHLKNKRGLTFEQTSAYFEISISTLFRWHKNMVPCIKRNRPAIRVDMEVLKEDIDLHPDKYQWERAQQFGVSQSTMHYALKRLGVSYKKNSKAPKSERRSSYKLPKKN